MPRFDIFVCENFAPEFSHLVLQGGYDDVRIVPYPSMCQNKSHRQVAQGLLQENLANQSNGLVLCSHHCDMLGMIPEASRLSVRTSNYCFGHLANDSILSFILSKGSYIISLGWLMYWQRNIEEAGFDQETARKFYRDFSRELLFFDAGIDADSEQKLIALSEYLDLPYVIVPFELESIAMVLKSVVNEWRLQTQHQLCSGKLSEIQTQCSEYSAILSLMGKIAAFTNKRDAIEQIKTIFLTILGAQSFRYWDLSLRNAMLPEEISGLIQDGEQDYFLQKEASRFAIKIQHTHKVYGVIDVSDFLFPQYFEKYLNFSLEIIKVCGLVMFNIEQYEKLLRSEQDLQYLSFHDSLTGLYNRTYINEIISGIADQPPGIVFMFDVDRLKQVNDTYGHLEGDKLICTFGTILQSSFRETDITARIGGDEFLAVIPENDPQIAEIIIGRIQSAIRQNNETHPQRAWTLSVSHGYQVSSAVTDTVEDLMHKADSLMYIHKAEKC